MAASGVPAGGGEGDQDQGGDEHDGGAAVLAPAERAAGLDDAPGGRAESPGAGALCSDVAAGCPLEGSGGGSQLGSGGGRGGLGDRVQEFSDADELGGGFIVVAVEEDGSALGGADGAASFSGGRGPVRPVGGGRRRCPLGSSVGEPEADFGRDRSGANLEPGYQIGSPWRLRSPGRATL
ncbi:hypothetical protein [Streptomyces cyaneofuscatus]|uniref:hypothetical protein n=1 Tax=Streptomyces cyaneofuscatus TaxID=66883 RepID=UPI003F53E6FA